MQHFNKLEVTLFMYSQAKLYDQTLPFASPKNIFFTNSNPPEKEIGEDHSANLLPSFNDES